MEKRLGTVVGFCTVGFLARMSYALARTPVLALFAASLGAGPEAVGLAVAISTVTGIFFKMPAGVISDVVGRRRTLLAGLAVFAFVPLAYPFVESYAALVVVRFLHGFATAIYGPVAMAAVIAMAGERRAETLGWFSSVTILGNLVGAPLGGMLLTVLAAGGANSIGHYHLVYGAVAGFGFAALLLALWVLREEEEPGHERGRALADVWRQFRTGVREILLDPRVLATSHMEGVQNLAVGALEAFLPIYVVMAAGLSPLEAGLLWGVQMVATVIAKPWMGRWSDRVGRSALIFWGVFVCAIPFALIPWFTSFPALLTLAAVFGLGEAVVTSSTAAQVADLCKERHLGSAMGTFGTIFDVGHASGPLLAGLLIGAFGGSDYRVPFAVIAGILVLSALLFRRVMARPTALVSAPGP